MMSESCFDNGDVGRDNNWHVKQPDAKLFKCMQNATCILARARGLLLFLSVILHATIARARVLMYNNQSWD
jgi:hypothetical protein